MSEEFSCSFEQAALNNARDGLQTTVQQRWEWLSEAMEVSVAHARRRAQRGEVTLDSNFRVWWSPEMGSGLGYPVPGIDLLATDSRRQTQPHLRQRTYDRTTTSNIHDSEYSYKFSAEDRRKTGTVE